MSMKGKIKENSIPANRTQEKIICHEILALSNTFTETPNRVFYNTTYWDMLSHITTKLTSNTINIDNTDSVIDSLITLTKSVFDKHDKSTEDYTVDYALLDDNVVGAFTGESRETIGK